MELPPSESKEEKTEEETQEDVQTLINGIVEALEKDGATNMLIDTDPFEMKDGSNVIQLSGTLDLLNPDTEKRIRCRLISIILPFKQVQIELRMLYAKEDRYGDQIEARIIESLEVLKEL